MPMNDDPTPDPLARLAAMAAELRDHATRHPDVAAGRIAAERADAMEAVIAEVERLRAAVGRDRAANAALEAERDALRRELRELMGDADPDWDLRYAKSLIENVTLAREVERLRMAATEKGSQT